MSTRNHLFKTRCITTALITVFSGGAWAVAGDVLVDDGAFASGGGIQATGVSIDATNNVAGGE